MTAEPHRTAQWIAGACVLLMLVVTTASAWLRLSQPRPACPDWPSCRSLDRPALRSAAPALLGAPQTVALVRVAHRVAASLVLLLVLALAVLGHMRRSRHRGVAAFGVVLSALALGLAALGIVTPGSRAPAVLLGNLLAGMLMLGLAWSLVRYLRGAPVPSRPLAHMAWAGALLWAVQASLGALAGARLAALAPLAHVAVALVAAPLAFAVGGFAWRQGLRVEGVAVMTIVVAQFAQGRAAAGWAAAPAAVLAHNVLAAAGIALLLGLALPPLRSHGPAGASATIAR